MLEITVKVSNCDQTFVTKYLEYSEDILLSKDDPKLSDMVDKAVKAFGSGVEDVVVRIKMVW